MADAALKTAATDDTQELTDGFHLIIDAMKLNDIKTDQTLLGRIFDYGDVEILTANEVGNNVFRHIAHPLRFKTTMLEAKQKLDDGIH